MKKITLKDYFKERFTNKIFMTIIAIYILFCFGSAIYWVVCRQAQGLLISIGYSLLIFAVFFAEYLIDLRCGEIFIAAILSLAVGGLSGTVYNLYTVIPFFDLILHTLSGVLFACLGFALADRFFDGKDKRSFFGKLIFAVCFSLAIAVVWEMFEYTCTILFGFDMMEDAYVTEIRSYLLSGSHSSTVIIEDITKTVIYYGNGQTYTITEGYLDLGLIDTLTDMIVCVLGAIVFAAVSIFSFFKCPKINEMLIPQIATKTEKSENS